MLRPASLVASICALTFSACGDMPAGPNPVAPASADPVAVTARIQPTIVPMNPVAGSSCPSLSPFTVVIDSRARFDMSVDLVTFHFLDGSNISSQPFGMPTRATVPSGSSVSLPFAPQFGCGMATPHWIVADVELIDASGGVHNVTVRAQTH